MNENNNLEEESHNLLGGNVTDVSQTITKNNWEEDYNAFVEDIRSNYGEFHPSLAKYVGEFISNLLTKKDQEHKAELESIKGECLIELCEDLYEPDYLDEDTEENKVTNKLNYNLFLGYQQGYKQFHTHIEAILDSHINKTISQSSRES